MPAIHCMLGSMLLLGALLGVAVDPVGAGLDPTFGGDGIVATPIGTSSAAFEVLEQPDGSIVAAGSATIGSEVVAVVRHLPDGSLDPGFGTGGIVTTAVGTGAHANSFVLQADGKLVVAGATSNGTDDAVLLVRYEMDGTLDASFGSGGIVVTTLALTAVANAVALDADDKLVVAGTVGAGYDADVLVLRYDTNGVLDPTFDGDGIVTSDLGTPGQDLGNAVVLQADGGIVVGGSSNSNASLKLAMARFTTTGALDPTFGAAGVVVTSYEAVTGHLVIQSDQKLVLAGGNANITIARYLSDGSPDTTFGDNGARITASGVSFPIMIALALQPTDRILIGGVQIHVTSIHPPTFTGDAMLMRLVNDGDTVDVFQTFELGSTGDALLGVGAQADGKLLGASWANDTFTVIRYEVVICGDGVVHATEQCDDGNLTNGDGCDQNCTPTACGNGIVTAGETCDDTNAIETDCCLSTCQRAPTGSACGDDGNLCTDDVCTAGGSCSHVNNALPCDDNDGCTIGDTCSGGQCVTTPLECQLCEICDPGLSACVERPAPSCLGVPVDARTRLQVTDKLADKSDRLQWQRLKAYDTDREDFGDPIGTDDYALCLYDESSPTPTLLSRWRTRRGACGSAPCWKTASTTGFKFRDKELTPDGLDSVALKGSTGSPSSIKIKGRGANLAPPTLPLPLPVRVQLQSTTGRCWEATYSSAGVSRNDGGQFKGAND